MTDPSTAPGAGDSEHRPTQAELDAEDLAELRRTSTDRDRAELYPRPRSEPGAPPAALVTHARVVWWAAAIACLVCVVYGFAHLGQIEELLRARLLQGAAQGSSSNRLTPEKADSLAHTLPVPMLIAAVLLLVVEYITLVATATHHSRGSRSVFLTLVVVNVLCIPIGLDLLFRYDELWSAIVVIGWMQAALLVVAAVMTLRRSVDRWLPESTRIRPGRMMRNRT